MIKLEPQTRATHETLSRYDYMDAGELKQGEIRVQYYSLTTKQRKELRNKLLAEVKENPNAVQWFTDSLVLELHALPDIAGPDGKPIEITQENLDMMDSVNIEYIRKAIDEDIAGKVQPPK